MPSALDWIQVLCYKSLARIVNKEVFFVSLGTTYIVLSFSVHIIGFYLDGTGVALVFIESTRLNSNQWRPGSNLASGDLSELSLFMVLLYFNGHCLTASNQTDARE